MTNKKFRDDLAKEMRDKYNERNEKLEQAEKSSFSSGLKEQMKKEIMDNFTKEMDEMKSRPGYEEAKKTHLEEIKAKIGVNAAKKEKERLQKEYEEKLAKADEEIAENTKEYEEAQISHRGKIEDDGNVSENLDIPQDLKDFRQAWKEKILEVDETVKNKIEEVAKTIPVRVETEKDESRLIEFKLGGKKWKILDPKLKTHSDEKYKRNPRYNSITYIDDAVALGGMWGDNLDEWENKKLAEYVKQKQREGLHIAKIEDMKQILSELGKQADLEEEADQVAMLMYLTGMDGWYRLSMGDDENSSSQASSRSLLSTAYYRDFHSYDLDIPFDNASLCMIACQ